MSTELGKAAEVRLENGMVKLNSIEESYRFAKAVVSSGLAPSSSFKTPEAVMIAVQMGAELGFLPMQSLNNIAVINGRASIWGKAAPAIALSKGLLEKFEERFEGEGDNLRAICTVKRKGLASEKTGEFSVAQAKKAGLMGKDTYQKYTHDLLMWKARARAFILFSDVLLGLPIYEDLQGHETLEHAPVVAQIVETEDPLLKQIEHKPEPVSTNKVARSERPVEPVSQDPAVPAASEASPERVTASTTGAQPSTKKRGGRRIVNGQVQAFDPVTDKPLPTNQPLKVNDGIIDLRDKPTPPQSDTPVTSTSGSSDYPAQSASCRSDEMVPVETLYDKINKLFDGISNLSADELYVRCAQAWAMMPAEERAAAKHGIDISEQPITVLQKWNPIQLRRALEELRDACK